MKAVFDVIKALVNHPMNEKIGGVIGRFLKYQLLLKKKRGTVINWIDNSKLYLGKGLTVASGNYYFGLFEYKEMHFVLHLLTEKDFMIDVGANIGDYSIIASNCCGAHSIAVEPIPELFEIMHDNVVINNIYDKVDLYNMGASDKTGELYFVVEGATSHIANDDEIRDESKEVSLIKVDLLDRICNKLIADQEKHYDLVVLKIDVEGLEYNVIKGAERVLEVTDVILAECNGLSEEYYGSTRDNMLDYLKSRGFYMCNYTPENKTLSAINSINKNEPNVIFVRDIDRVNSRLRNSKKHSVFGKSIE